VADVVELDEDPLGQLLKALAMRRIRMAWSLSRSISIAPPPARLST